MRRLKAVHLAFLAVALLAFAIGLNLGAQIVTAEANQRVKSIEAERDSARRDADACFMALKVLGEGGQRTETMATPRISQED